MTKFMSLILISINFAGNVVIIGLSDQYKQYLKIDKNQSNSNGKLYAILGFVLPFFLTPFLLNFLIRKKAESDRKEKEFKRKVKKFHNSRKSKLRR